MNLSQQTAETGAYLSKAASIQAAGSGLQVAGGGTAVFFGMSQGEWQAVGVIGGLLIGVVGICLNAVVSAYFKHQHYKLAKKRRAIALHESGEDE